MITKSKPHFLAKGSEVFLHTMSNICLLLTPRLWFGMLIVSFMSVLDILAFYMDHHEGLLRIFGLICFACFKASVYTLAINFTRGLRWLYVFTIGVVSICAILSLINGISYVMYGFGINRKMLYVLTETNAGEVMEFISVMPEWIGSHILTVKTLLFMVCVVVIYVLIGVIPRNVINWLIMSLSMIGIFYSLLYMSQANWGRSNHFIALRTASCLLNYKKSIDNMRSLTLCRRELPYPETATSLHYAKNIVFVIGESASRSHHSLYGYRLATTPHLDTIKSGLYAFNNVVASSTLTSENIPRILTFMKDIPNDKEWYEYPTIIQLMKKMGYATGWISNQERTGKFSNLSVILSEDADYVEYVGAIDSEDHLMGKYDEAILPPYRKIMSDNDSLRFVCLHLMGSHMDFRYRYPLTRSRFSSTDELKGDMRPWLNKSKAQMIAEYDNSILYTDSVLNEVISSIRNLPEPSVMVYLSDHGHTVYDYDDYYGRDINSADVPFIVYVNDAYKDKYPEIVRRIEESKKHHFSTSETIHMILTLSGGMYVSYEESADPLSPAFNERRRYFDGELLDK